MVLRNALLYHLRSHAHRCVAKSFSNAASQPVIYRDQGIFVLNKPPGLVSQDVRAIQNFIGEESLAENSNIFTVHRLDKDTTGCFIVARNPQQARNLAQQFAGTSVTKIYLALVRGGSKTFSSASGKIQTYMQFIDGYPTLATGANGKESITEWEIVSSSPKYPLTLVRLNLKTGLKHQLRLHMAKCLQAPILGDHTYGSSKLNKSIMENIIIPDSRMYLHASQLTIWKYKQISNGKHQRVAFTFQAALPDYFLKTCKDASIEIPPEARISLTKEELV